MVSLADAWIEAEHGWSTGTQRTYRSPVGIELADAERLTAFDEHAAALVVGITTLHSHVAGKPEFVDLMNDVTHRDRTAAPGSGVLSCFATELRASSRAAAWAGSRRETATRSARSTWVSRRPRWNRAEAHTA
jgi:hypothetical protein